MHDEIHHITRKNNSLCILAMAVQAFALNRLTRPTDVEQKTQGKFAAEVSKLRTEAAMQ